MKWMVTLRMRDGTESTQEVFANNKGDAEYRAAVQAETRLGKTVERVVVTRRTASVTAAEARP